MNALLPAAVLLFVATATPGPNNLVVMRAAAHAGFASALPAIAGIVAGGLAMLAVVIVGGDRLFELAPVLRWSITLLGGAYLAWLGARLVLDSVRNASSTSPQDRSERILPAGSLGLFGFQFLNPKAWVIVLTVTAAVPLPAPATLLALAALFVLTPSLCLALWAGLGSLLTRRLGRPKFRRAFDLLMGVLLIASALALEFAQ